MSVYVVERPDRHEWLNGLLSWEAILGPWAGPTRLTGPVVEIRDPNEHDGEWPAYITMPHEHVEYEGRAVPLFEGDVERREWEARRRGRHARS